MFDWVTWSIWFVGFVILVVWIVLPARELVGIVKAQHAAYKRRTAGDDAAGAGGEREDDA